jgi:hypothetical protein
MLRSRRSRGRSLRFSADWWSWRMAPEDRTYGQRTAEQATARDQPVQPVVGHEGRLPRPAVGRLKPRASPCLRVGGSDGFDIGSL